MGLLQIYLNQHRGIRNTTLAVCLLLAAVALYLGVGLSLFLIGNLPNPVLDRLLPVSCFVTLVFLDLAAARLIQISGRKRFWPSLLHSFAITLGGALLLAGILMSLALIRQVK